MEQGDELERLNTRKSRDQLLSPNWSPPRSTSAFKSAFAEVSVQRKRGLTGGVGPRLVLAIDWPVRFKMPGSISEVSSAPMVNWRLGGEGDLYSFVIIDHRSSEPSAILANPRDSVLNERFVA